MTSEVRAGERRERKEGEKEVGAIGISHLDSLRMAVLEEGCGHRGSAQPTRVEGGSRGPSEDLAKNEHKSKARGLFSSVGEKVTLQKLLLPPSQPRPDQEVVVILGRAFRLYREPGP